MNLSQFRFKIDKTHVCDEDNVLLLVLVSSAPAHSNERNAIRQTWARPDQEVKVLFLLGDVVDETLQNRIAEEDSLFGDIVQGNFIDSYRNMTYKSVMSMKYVAYRCRTTKFVLKCDDDVFVNMPLMKVFLKHDLRYLPSGDYAFCSVNVDMPVIRSSVGEEAKWYVSYDEWPRETYPIYCAGWYVIMRTSTAVKVYAQAQETPFFWIDDVFLTGIVTEQLGHFIFVDMNKFTVPRDRWQLVVNGTFNEPFLFGSINMLPVMIRSFWGQVLSKPVRSSLFDNTSFTRNVN
ncbi:hypothetical protein GWI33_003023 [Rhynchophorus ferrugineus]|uniref:Hexosyltransferase n=1 Tax=Rhynchophorus ferrugineus TaxID=354439 RepID=A0A834MG16_RHYFE|nr:hypothetical protein GWI33_003023 [Rhynchophorus ferrugineus]